MYVCCVRGAIPPIFVRELMLCKDGKLNTVIITVLFPWFASLGKVVSDHSIEIYAALCIVASTIVMTTLMKSWLFVMRQCTRKTKR